MKTQELWDNKVQSVESMPLIAEDSDSSDNLEELKQEEYEKEMDLTEITDQLLKKFNDIKETTFSVISEKSNIEEQQRVVNREILKKNKSAEERQKNHIYFLTVN